MIRKSKRVVIFVEASGSTWTVFETSVRVEEKGSKEYRLSNHLKWSRWVTRFGGGRKRTGCPEGQSSERRRGEWRVQSYTRTRTFVCIFKTKVESSLSLVNVKNFQIQTTIKSGRITVSKGSTNLILGFRHSTRNPGIGVKGDRWNEWHQVGVKAGVSRSVSVNSVPETYTIKESTTCENRGLSVY